jgi:hypothetical protein
VKNCHQWLFISESVEALLVAFETLQVPQVLSSYLFSHSSSPSILFQSYWLLCYLHNIPDTLAPRILVLVLSRNLLFPGGSPPRLFQIFAQTSSLQSDIILNSANYTSGFQIPFLPFYLMFFPYNFSSLKNRIHLIWE